MRRKLIRIERNILISIQYKRLQEEINNANLTILELSDKKGVTTLKKKKIEGLNIHIKKIGTMIHDIEKKYRPKQYQIITKNQLENKLIKLSKQNYFEMLKYNIAIEIILDNSIEYKYSEKFFEYLSEVLFKDQSTMITIQKTINDIYWYFNKDNQSNKTIDIVSKKPLKFEPFFTVILKKTKFYPKILWIDSIFYGVGIGTKMIQKRRSINKMRKLSKTQFEYTLSTTLLCLQYAKKVLPELENKKYFSTKLQIINKTRGTILKEFFEESYDVKENLVKIKSLKVFDNYLIEEMKFYV